MTPYKDRLFLQDNMDSHSYMCSETETREHWSTISSPSVQLCLGLTCDTCVSHFKDEGFPLLNSYRKLPSTYTPDTSRFSCSSRSGWFCTSLTVLVSRWGRHAHFYVSFPSQQCMHAYRILIWSGNEGSHVVLPCTTCSRHWPQIPTFSPVSDLLQGFKRTTVVMPRDAKAYVASKKSETSDLELAQEWAEIEELYLKRYFCGLFLYSSITNVGGGIQLYYWVRYVL